MSLPLATNAERTKYICSILFKKIAQKCNDNWGKIEMMMKLTSEFDSWAQKCNDNWGKIEMRMKLTSEFDSGQKICHPSISVCHYRRLELLKTIRSNFLNNNFTRHQLDNLPVKIQWTQKPSDITRYSKEHKCRSIVSHFHKRIRNKIITETISIID